MNYTEAVSLARSGEQRGFGYLYANTYKSKYLLACQYMKNEETAQDVLQEAYLKAFASLDKLNDPEKFPAWLGTIVANTAKNMLAKKNPMLFSDPAADDENEAFEYQIEDENTENQPEISYTRQETQALVHELIDSLSEEQRMCILMFHIEDIPISEIAAAMNCSENTVKSRLNYGRKNLRIKAEELQKKGYKLYGIAPLPLLVYLLRLEETYLTADGTLAAAGELIADRLFSHSPGTGMSGEVQKAAADAAQKTGTGRAHTAAHGAHIAAKTGFLHTAAAKAAAIILATCVAGGGVLYGVSQLNREEPETEVTQEEPGREGKTESAQEPVSEEPQDVRTIEEIYADVLRSVENQEPGYEFTDAGAQPSGYQYFIHDIDGDGIEELIVGAEFSTGTAGQFIMQDCRVFSCSETEAGYELKVIEGNAVVEKLYIPSDGNGLYCQEFLRGTGQVSIYMLTIQNGILTRETEPEHQFTFGDAAMEEFTSSNLDVQWTSITNTP